MAHSKANFCNPPPHVIAESALTDLLKSWSTAFDRLEKKGNLSELCIGFFKLDEQYQRVDAVRKQLYALLDRIDKGVLPEALEKSGLEKVSVPEIGYSFYIVSKYSASIVDKEKAYEWLRKRGVESFITETVNAGTLAAYLKNLLLEEGIDPPDSMKLYSYKTTGVSKYTPKGKGVKK